MWRERSLEEDSSSTKQAKTLMGKTRRRDVMAAVGSFMITLCIFLFYFMVTTNILLGLPFCADWGRSLRNNARVAWQEAHKNSPQL
jgi:membrane-anchored glycerophosphoryl diester phosphodiesterase (GDPDase)